MIKKKKIPIKSLVLILILVELICLVFALGCDDLVCIKVIMKFKNFTLFHFLSFVPFA